MNTFLQLLARLSNRMLVSHIAGSFLLTTIAVPAVPQPRVPGAELRPKARELTHLQPRRIIRYWWLTKQRMLVFASGESDSRPSGPGYYVLNIESGALEPISPGVTRYTSFPIRPSPDGRRFLLEDDESGKLIWIVVDVADGHEYARAKTMNSPQLIEADWLPDGSGWAQLRPGNGNTVCGVFKFSKSGRYNEPVASPMAFHINSFGLIGLVDAGKVLVLGEDKSDGHGNIGKSVTMYALKATSTMVGSAEFSVSDAVIGETALSHDGKRLCWLAFSAKHPFAPGLTATFTVTDVGCRSRRILHSIEFSTLDQMSLLFGDIPKSELPTSIKWTADDKEISYLIGESLWAIAAPQ